MTYFESVIIRKKRGLYYDYVNYFFTHRKKTTGFNIIRELDS